MNTMMSLIKPKFIPPLDEEFRPAVLANHAFEEAVRASRVGVSMVIALERNDGGVARLERQVFPAGHARSQENLMYTERLVKFLLWQVGGWKIYLSAPGRVVTYIRSCYSETGKNAFDYHFMGEDVYLKPFTIAACKPDEVPLESQTGQAVGRHLEGCRIGFDLGASDLKVSAVMDGKPIFSQEIVWAPRTQSDPHYHYEHIMAALKLAAAQLPRVDAIGGSSAGIIINNRIMIASLFRGVPRENYDLARNIFLRIRAELGVPLEVANDGDVTALAGAMSLEDNPVLGIALGSSQAAGYTDRQGSITGWLNELAFTPVDYNPLAPVEEWSKDRGCGASYFSQQCVFRLAPKAGIEIPGGIADADRLKFVQEKLEAGHAGACQIWQSMGIYMGYALAHYADFYDLKHILVLGRCTSGLGGQIILDGANEVLHSEFPGLAGRLNVQLPDEKSRRVGQSIAAASLPAIKS